MSGPPSKTPQVLLWEVIFETFWSLGHTVQTVARCQGDDKAPNSSLPLAERPTGMTLVFCAYRFPCFPGSEMQNIAHGLSFFSNTVSVHFFFSPRPLSHRLFRLPLTVEGIGSRADSGPISHSVSAGTVIKAGGRGPVPAAAQFSH